MKLHALLKKIRIGKGYSKQFIAKELELKIEELEFIECGRKNLFVDELIKFSSIYYINVSELLQENLCNPEPLNLSLKIAKVLTYLRKKINLKKLKLNYTYFLYFIDFNYFHKHGDQMMGICYTCSYADDYDHFDPLISTYSSQIDTEFIDTEKDLSKYDELKLYEEELEIIDGVINYLKDMETKEILEVVKKDPAYIHREEGENRLSYSNTSYRGNYYEHEKSILSKMYSLIEKEKDCY